MNFVRIGLAKMSDPHDVSRSPNSQRGMDRNILTDCTVHSCFSSSQVRILITQSILSPR